MRSITDKNNKKVLFFDQVDRWQDDQPVLVLALLYAVLCWISLSAMDVRMPVMVRLMVCAICFLGGQKRKEITSYHRRHATDISVKVILLLAYLYTVLAFGGIYLLDPISEFNTFYGTSLSFLSSHYHGAEFFPGLLSGLWVPTFLKIDPLVIIGRLFDLIYFRDRYQLYMAVCV